MSHSSSTFPTETLFSVPFSVDLFSTSIHSTEPYRADNFSISNASNISGGDTRRCTYKEDFKQILLPAVYTIVFVLGIPLNAAVILKIWRTRPSLSRNSIYMVNLAIADFLYVMSLPLLIFNYANHDYWPFGEFACKLVRFQFYRWVFAEFPVNSIYTHNSLKVIFIVVSPSLKQLMSLNSKSRKL